MAKRISVLNGGNNTQDYDIQQYDTYGLTTGISEKAHLEVQPQGSPDNTVIVKEGVVAIDVTRVVDGKTFKVFGELTADENVTVLDTGSNPTWIGAIIAVVPKAKVEDGSGNAENGTGVFDVIAVAGLGTSPLSDAQINSQTSNLYYWYRLADVLQDPTVESGDITDTRELIGAKNVAMRNDEPLRARNNADDAFIDVAKMTTGDKYQFQVVPEHHPSRVINSDYQLIDFKFFNDNNVANPTNFGGTGADGILNITSGTTNLNAGTYQYAGLTLSSGATLSTTSVSGFLKILCSGDITIAGDIDLSEKITDKTPSAVLELAGGGAFTPTGAMGSSGGGGGGGGGQSSGQDGGDGGDGDGGGAGGNGGGGGIRGAGGIGGSSTGGSGTLGKGGDGNFASADGEDGGDHAGGGGGNGGAGGGAGNPAGAGDGVGQNGGSTFGSAGGDSGKTAGGGGGAGAEGGKGGMDLIINCLGEFDGTGGTINLSGEDGNQGGAGGSSNIGGGSNGCGGGGGGGGEGGGSGSLRIVHNGTYTAVDTETLDGGSGGGGGAGGAGDSGSPNGSSGSSGSAGADGSSEATLVNNIY